MPMKKILGMAGVAALFIAVLAFNYQHTADAVTAPNWDMTGTYEWTVLGTYHHDIIITSQLPDGSFSGSGGYPAGNSPYNLPGQTTETITGQVMGDNFSLTTVYNGPYNPGYTVTIYGTIAYDGSISMDAAAVNPWSWTMSGNATYLAWGEILAPDTNAIVYGNVDLKAIFDDHDAINEGVQWAVRKGTCAAGTNTVWGNVDGHNDPYAYDGMNFMSTIDTVSATPGMYCFVFNPKGEPAGQDVRETREFFIASQYLNGGGHALEVLGSKRKDWNDVSFGGWTAYVGSLVGDWEVNLHNVGGTDLDGGKFHGSDIVSLNLFNGDSATCTDAANVTVNGTWNGLTGYQMIFRAGDNGAPNTMDTIRVTLYRPDHSVLYDTYGPDFTAESSCVGSARTGLDTGNITIYQ